MLFMFLKYSSTSVFKDTTKVIDKKTHKVEIQVEHPIIWTPNLLQNLNFLSTNMMLQVKNSTPNLMWQVVAKTKAH